MKPNLCLDSGKCGHNFCCIRSIMLAWTSNPNQCSCSSKSSILAGQWMSSPQLSPSVHQGGVHSIHAATSSSAPRNISLAILPSCTINCLAFYSSEQFDCTPAVVYEHFPQADFPKSLPGLHFQQYSPETVGPCFIVMSKLYFSAYK